ncbi:MAG: tRNA threonylcarbamoyladenosine dehydratase [Anaeroplasmataceae bacterium]
MEKDFISRTALLVGYSNIDKLKQANIIVFGVGGVGGYCIEALVRAGIGNITIVDNDTVSITNINRQIVATNSTISKYKVDVMKQRILDINPLCNVTVKQMFYTKDTYNEIDLNEYDFVVDAIDTVTSKLYLAEYCYFNNIKIISSMGTGNRLDPTKFKYSDIFKTKNDPLSKVMRSELKKRNVKSLTVVYSDELPLKPIAEIDLSDDSSKRQTPASISFVPPISGLLLASYVINTIIKN